MFALQELGRDLVIGAPFEGGIISSYFEKGPIGGGNELQLLMLL